MKTFITLLNRYFLLATLPAVLAFAGCKKDNNNPARGQVQLVHAAPSAPVRVRALVNDNELTQLDYGQASSYLGVDAGTPTLSINVASSGATQVATTTTLNVAADQNYSAFIYSPTSTTVGVLSVTDDLTAPTAGQAKIRIVHLLQNGPATVMLSQATAAGQVSLPGASATFATTSNFIGIPAGTYNLTVTTGSSTSPTTIVSVGDGSGSGSGTKNYEAGKIYTVVVRGIVGGFDPNYLAKAIIVTNK